MMFKQVECRFKSGDADCIGTLYLPTATADNKIPCIVLGHGFGGVRKMLAPFAEAFAAAGWAALTFDYRNFGDSGGVNRQVLNVGKQLEDWRAAIAYARSLPMADQNHICIWGSSLGGGHVLSLAAEDHGLRAAISQVPHISGWAAFRTMGIAHSLRVTPFVIADLFSCLFLKRRYLLPLLGSPGTHAIMTGDDGSGYLTMAETLAPGTCLDVAAASVLSIALYFPGRKIHKVRCPLLMIVANRDGTTPAKQSLAAARRADRAEVVQFDSGHFDVYLEPILSRSLARQIAFLQQQV